jgi:hypothetical protein
MTSRNHARTHARGTHAAPAHAHSHANTPRAAGQCTVTMTHARTHAAAAAAARTPRRAHPHSVTRTVRRRGTVTPRHARTVTPRTGVRVRPARCPAASVPGNLPVSMGASVFIRVMITQAVLQSSPANFRCRAPAVGSGWGPEGSAVRTLMLRGT